MNPDFGGRDLRRTQIRRDYGTAQSDVIGYDATGRAIRARDNVSPFIHKRVEQTVPNTAPAPQEMRIPPPNTGSTNLSTDHMNRQITGYRVNNS